jgi:hypothetical protein
VEQTGVQPLIAGVLDRVPQLARFRRATGPYRLIAVCDIKTTQQLVVHPFARHRQLARDLEQRLEFGITEEGSHVGRSGVGLWNGGTRRRRILSGLDRKRAQ